MAPLPTPSLPPIANDVGNARALWRKLGGFMALSAVFALLGALGPLRTLWNGDAGIELVRQLGFRGPLVILLAGTLAPFAFLPRWPLAVGCGILYGVGWGGLLANVASTLGAWLQFRFARRALSPAAARLLARHGRRLVGLPPRKAFALLVALRVFPLSNFVVTNLLAASLDLSPGAYVAGTFFGMIPSTLMYGAWGRIAAHPNPTSYAVMAGLFVVVASLAWVAKGWLSRAEPAAERKEDSAP